MNAAWLYVGGTAAIGIIVAAWSHLRAFFGQLAGRVDRVLACGPLDEDGRRQLANRILADSRCDAAELVMAGDGDTGAQFQERCITAVMQDHFAERMPCG